MKWLRFLLPQSLRARLLWLILGVVLLAQAVTLYAIALHQHGQTQAAAVNLLVTSVRALQASIQVIEPEQRAAWVDKVSGGQWRLISRDLPRQARRLQSGVTQEALASVDPQLRRSLRMMAREVNQALGKGSRVAVSAGEQPYLYVAILQGGETARDDAGPVGSVSAPGAEQQRARGQAQRTVEWLQIPLDRVDPPLTQTTLIGWLASLGVLLLIAAGFSWHITRPVTDLLRATQRLAAGRSEPVDPAGPIEIRRLGEGFNAMLASLKQADQTQRTLLAGLPHDLKGPLSRMALRIEMADDPQLKEGLKRDLDDMQRLVEQFLAYIRGQDTAAFELARMSLDTWLAQQVAEMQRLGREVLLSGDLARVDVLADRRALERLLENLVDNAMTYGLPPVEIALSTAGDWVTLMVMDHGPGVAVEDRERVLEPFVRLDQARTRTGSAGLGLSVVQAIAVAHGGRVELDQSPSGGLCVRIVLPIER